MDTGSRAENTPSSASLRRSRTLVWRCSTASTRLRSSRPVCGVVASGRSPASSMITDRRRSLASCSAMYCRCSSNTPLSFPAALRVMRAGSYICRSQPGQYVSAVVAPLSTACGSLERGSYREGGRQLVPVDIQTALVPTLAGGYYTDPAVLAAECERIFERQWYYVGRA